ncbi:hypothetical protein HU200_049703 [Digitaria exilis]|uniref:DUF1618 domain-containing protein n=1 Tax=Digitaria exilis TaxID=1010633 RepID=A0A835B4J1_9POAL|nr:hypothetical protein HU200_049703 [Digitaria exilis]
MAAAGAAPLPSWVMLERFVFRRDDPETFREDERTSARSVTSAGAPFHISFILAEPPTPSRLYVSWPEGPKEGIVCHLVAAHRGLVLLRLDSVVMESTEKHPTPFKMVIHDYFVYIPGPLRPSLKLLPAYAKDNSIVGRPILYPFETHSVGLLRRGEEEFALAYLGIARYSRSVGAQLWVLRSTVAPPSNSGGDSCVVEKWEIKKIPIKYRDEEFKELYYWLSHAVVPFQNSLCWVNYNQGILFCDDVLGDRPSVSYHRLPMDSFLRQHTRKTRNELYRGLCVTEGGQKLMFVDVARDDGTGIGQMAPSTGFTITSYIARRTDDGFMQWDPVDEVKSSELWEKNTPACLPRDVMILPLLSMDKPDAAHIVLYEWRDQVGKVSLVTIDLKDKRVVGSVVNYIRGVEDLATDDADLVNMKPY